MLSYQRSVCIYTVSAIYKERWWCIESEREKKRAFSVKEGEVGYSGTAESCDMTQMHWCWRERERERAREGGGWEERGGVWNHTAVLFILNQSTWMLTHTHLHTHTHTHTLTYTHRGRHYSCEQMAPHKHSMKATSTVAFDTAAKNKWDQLYTLLVSRTCRTEGDNMSTPARSHTHRMIQTVFSI